MVRSVAAAASVIRPIRDAIHNLSADEVVYGFKTMDTIVSSSVAARRFSMIRLAAFAALAPILARAGSYGVISCLAGQRTHEIGVRVALGAQRRDVLRLVLGQGTGMTLTGIVIGLTASFALTRLM